MGTPFFGLTEGVTPWGREGDFTQAPRGIPYAYESTQFLPWVSGGVFVIEFEDPSVVNDFDLTNVARRPGGG
jgi:hypothetical protein